ncbi:hypothetical protein NQZ79_g8601 [Umbelopsis isabellina]|nr:hypothetical protein NQZ79_g8601 [Umbelopsis isabellina]
MAAEPAHQAVILWYLHGCTASHFDICESEHQQTGPRERTFTQTFSNNLVSLTGSRIAELTIPVPAISRLSQLHTLHLQNNHLTYLPAEIWSLSGLQELNVGYNKLKKLPPGIQKAQSLQELFLHNNQLTELPPQIGSLGRLRVLDVTANQLSTIPAEIKKLPLSHLWVEFNYFSTKNTSTRRLSEIGLIDSKAPSEANMLSLFAICSQIVGARIENSNPSLFYELSSTVQYHLEKCKRLALLCAICNSLIFHSGLVILGTSRISGMLLPVSYHCCSQTCKSRLLKGSPMENLEEEANSNSEQGADNQIHSHRASLQLHNSSEQNTLTVQRSMSI